jgi:PD-(D/E)XK endonuclease
LRDAAASIAASWFALCGFNVAIPMEPTFYDLLVSMPEGIKRVQVKTTTFYSKDGWTVPVSRRPYSIGNRERRVPYDPELIDWFLIIDGDLNIYLIPSRVIAGRITILLHTYTKYVVGNAAGLMAPVAQDQGRAGLGAAQGRAPAVVVVPGLHGGARLPGLRGVWY